MAMQDSNPERRNLTLSSLSFIAYFYGGGSFKDGSVKFPMLNVSFDNMLFVSIMVWVLLFWFFYRYWQAHYGEFSANYSKEIYNYGGRYYVANYLSKKAGIKLVTYESKGYVLTGLKRENGRLYVSYNYGEGIERDKRTGEIQSYSIKQQGVVELNGVMGSIIKCRIALSCCVVYPSFSNYMVPYILFFMAVIGPFYQIYYKN
ncbi:hypothetical protein KO528_18685 [Saccharophagus degradans]|uniref:hypothetical protein n=1 Tax=Saccharophagus degradans TaxID=86304 RepID=UPI001C09D119|nr:hypothetical protein [Saccharophagus degradans]MBU2987398.1 hypothetical protein [Saccharophagus degradans]